ncbi:ABC transporter substrate-binding protein [Paraburkholderia sacchari]|nr:ABC transporter substrate-binding protein [Paraburkholderia sacchari]NLP63145.1 ABC transporter substrate-binding protein [Paraburkholderia sacchari]
MTLATRMASGLIAAAAAFSFAAGVAHADDKQITLGFAQVGAESAWRTANTVSVKAAAKEAGINLKFSDAQQKQENQIKAIRSYIAQKVDVIAFSPVVESGWEPVLQEAKRAKIPVILTDRNIDVKDQSLYVTMIGSDFIEEGRRAGKWLEDHYKDNPGPINIVELQGTVGSAPANDRHAGLIEVIKNDPKFKIIASQSGDFTLAGGKQVMEAFAKTYGNKINVVYAHNDDMALGAIQAMEEAGMKPGKDVSVVSFDATKGGFQAMIAGKMNVDVECSPLLGPQLMSAVKDVVAGKQLPKRIVTNETVFPESVAAQVLPSRKY